MIQKLILQFWKQLGEKVQRDFFDKLIIPYSDMSGKPPIFARKLHFSRFCVIVMQMKRKKNLFAEALILYKNQKKIAKISARNRNVDWLQVKIAEIKKDKKKLERKK